MKNLIILIILGVGGYFSYQYFLGSSQQEPTPAAPTFNIYSLPEKCQSIAKSLEDAISRREVSATINGYTKGFRQCLRDAGLTESEIDKATDNIRGNR